jgi:diguanylate cyclase (GGDEF)-like protein
MTGRPSDQAEIPVEPGPALIDRTIASGFGSMVFPKVLEDRFERDTGAERCRQLMIRGLLGLALLDVFLLSDYQLMPDVIGLAAILRLLVVTPIAFVFLVATFFQPRPMIREGMQVAIMVLACCITPILMMASESPVREAGHHGLVLIVLFATIVQRVRFWYALVTVAAVSAIYFAILLGVLDLVEEEKILSFGMVFIGAVIFSLFACYSLEREQRLTYLLSLRDSLRNRELETISRRDPLTGLGNRRSLEETLEHLPATTAPDDDVAVLLLDIDHFKAYNDALGHQAGDLCLQRVAAILSEELRMGRDECFRYGGEEFLLVLRRTDLAGALAAAERMRQAIEDAAIPHPETRSGVVTASIGAAATMVGARVEPAELVAGADAALYAAKHAGRNQVWPRPTIRLPPLPLPLRVDRRAR